ncbi:HNH endonuclease signature motif containing protein [Corynebacterium occultum]|nr:HNH endonuclease signature motif containing protein [Corynebacterium occultum]
MAFHSLSSPDDPLAVAFQQAREAEYLAWRRAMPTGSQQERDFTELAATITRSTGIRSGVIASNLYALLTLDKLPQLKTLIEEHFHVDMSRLRTIDHQLTGICVELLEDPGFWEAVDERLSSLLSPTRANQLMPTSATITRALKELIRVLTPPEEEAPQHPSAQEETEHPEGEPGNTEPAPEPELPVMNRYHSTPQPDGSVLFEIRVDQVTATKIEEAVRARAKEQGIPYHQAFVEIFLMDVSVKVNLNLYQARDLPGSPGFLQPYGPLDPKDAEALAAAAQRIRDADAAAEKESPAYQTPPDIRAAVEGRDWLCRWPGCIRPASRCQMDHRINHADGGPTTAANLLALCDHHHARKTDEQVHYLLDPYTGDVYWLFQDGTWAIDRAEGPLAPKQRHWVQTLAQRQDRRRERARLREEEKAEQERTQRLKQKRERPLPSQYEDEEPPF